MKTIGNSIYVHIPQEKHNSIKLANGVELFLDADFEPLQQAMETGICVLTNDVMEAKGLSVGKEVLFSYLVALDSNIKTPEISQRDANMSKLIGVPSYHCADYFIYAYRDVNEEWTPFADFIFVSPIKYDVEQLPSGLFVPPLKEYYNQIGVVAFANGEYKKGDVVLFEKNADYDLRIHNNNFISRSSNKGEVIWRMRTENILATFEGVESAKKINIL